MIEITRCSALTVIGGIAATAVKGGAIAVRTTSPAELMRATVEHHLGPVNISDVDLGAITSSFAAHKLWLMPMSMLAGGYQFATSIGVKQSALMLVSEKNRIVLERFTRRVLVAFF